MAKDPSPLLGYNNNIRHKNRVFHIQTEDSGVRHPHVITHLFMDGGRILKSVKTSYAEHLGTDKMADIVRKMMKDQHKGMLIALRDGQFDVTIDGGEAPKPPAKKSGEAAAAAESGTRSAAADAVAPVSTKAPPAPVVVASPAPASVRAKQKSAPVLPVTMDKVDITEREDDHAPLSGPGLGAPLDLTPPPANLFRPRATGSYREVGDPTGGTDTKAQPSRPPSKGSSSVPPGAVVGKSSGLRSSSPPGTSKPPIRRTSSPPPPRVDEDARGQRRPVSAPVAVAKPSESRYASARPASIFGHAKPRGGSSIFGEDIISDKSLDEVIMSYLADDPAPVEGGGSKPSGARPVDPKRRR